MKELFLTYPIAAWSLVSVMVAGLFIMLLWEKMKWWWHNTWYSFPVIGKIASLKSDLNQDKETGWFKGERTLCQDYKKFAGAQDEHDFNEKISYITKAGDLGRHDTPKWIWLLTVALVFVEAMGFAYVLAGFTVPGASENTQQYGAMGIAFLISVILVALTHLSGHELYVGSKIKQARQEWAEDESVDHNGNTYKLRSAEIALAKPQSIDDDLPSYTQLANRVGIAPVRIITWITVIFVIAVAIGATYVRGTVLEQQILLEKTGKTPELSLSIKSDGDSLDLSIKENNSNTLPAADVIEQNKAEQKAEAEGTDNQRHGGWGTFIVLAFVFVFLQILGVIFGFRWGFAGKESLAAYNAIGRGRYSSYSEIRDRYQEVADMAQSKLEQLQQKMMELGGKTTKKIAGNTFRQFMEEERAKQTKERINEREHVANRAIVEASPLAAAKAAPVESKTQSVEASQALTVDSVLAQVDELSDTQAKKDYMSTLPADLRTQAIAAIKERKAAEEKAKSDTEMDGLF